MTWSGTARLAAVLAALIAVTWLVERAADRPAAGQAPLLVAPPERAHRIEFEEPAGRLTVVRGAAGWSDANGRPWRSDAPDDLLLALGGLRPTALDVPADTPDEEWGFGAAAMRLRVLDDRGGPMLALEIGRRNPAWTGRYARRAGAPGVLLVGALLDWELDKLRASSPSS